MKRQEIRSLTGLRFYYAAAFVLWTHIVTAFLIAAGYQFWGSLRQPGISE
jgi:hypothetical protein